jgi:hypothetical protein
VPHLHSLKSYTFATTITYYTLTLADFSAINYFLKLSQTLHLHTSKLSPRSYSANSLLKTATYQLPRRAAPYKTDFLDIPVPLIKSSIVQADNAACFVLRNRRTRRKHVTWFSPTPGAVWRHRGMFRRNRIPTLLRDVIASARKSCLPVGYLATLCCVIHNGLTCHNTLRHEGVCGSGGVALPFLALAGGKWSASSPTRFTPGTLWTGDWVRESK